MSSNPYIPARQPTTIGTANLAVAVGSYTATFALPIGTKQAWAAFGAIEEVDVKLDGTPVERVKGGWTLYPAGIPDCALGTAMTVAFQGTSAVNTVTVWHVI